MSTQKKEGRGGGRKVRGGDTSTLVPVRVTVLDENLRACEASVNGCHVQGALPFFALENSLEEEEEEEELRHVLNLCDVQRSEESSGKV